MMARAWRVWPWQPPQLPRRSGGSRSSSLTQTGSMLRPRCDLGSIYPGESAAALFRQRNTGSTAATLSTVTVAGAGLSIPDRPVLPATLAPRTAVDFIVSFQAASVGQNSASLQS